MIISSVVIGFIAAKYIAIPGLRIFETTIVMDSQYIRFYEGINSCVKGLGFGWDWRFLGVRWEMK